MTRLFLNYTNKNSLKKKIDQDKLILFEGNVLALALLPSCFLSFVFMINDSCYILYISIMLEIHYD